MKSLRYYLLAMLTAAFALPMLTSCLDSDDGGESTYRDLTQEEKRFILFEIGGDYEGKLYFENTKLKYDSIDIHYTITPQDSVLRLTDFDFKVLAHAAETGGNEVSQIVGAAGLSELEIVLHPYYTQDFAVGLYNFTYTNELTAQKTYTDDEEDVHTISIEMSQSVDYTTAYETRRYYSICEYFQKTMQGNLIIKSITVDATKYDIFFVSSFFVRHL